MRIYSLSLLALCLTVAAVPAAGTDIYDNGPINGSVDAWTINLGYVVSDTFTVGGGGAPIDGLTFGVWLFSGDVVTSVDVSITSDENGGTTYFSGTVALTQTNISTNGFGYQIASETGTFDPCQLGRWYVLAESSECPDAQRRRDLLGREFRSVVSFRERAGNDSIGSVHNFGR